VPEGKDSVMIVKLAELERLETFLLQEPDQQISLTDPDV
jgi:hypothetical protein